jgi:esterase/lipase
MDYVDDLDRFLTSVEQKEPGKHVYLFGHSMGGAIAALTAERHQPKLAGLMLSGPALVVDAPPLQIAAAVMAGVLTPKAPALKLPNKSFSSDPSAAAQMDKDELVSQPPAPASTAAGLIAGIAEIWAGTDALTMPVIAMHGTSDKLTAPAGSRLLIEKIPSADKQLKIYEGAYHDLLHEPDGRAQMVETDLLAWLDGHEGGKPVAADPPYRKRLAGKPRGWAQAVELAGGIGEDSTFAGRLAVEMARPRPLGWHGALVAERLGGVTVVELQPAGVAVRSNAIVLGVSGGGSLVGPQDGHTLAFALSGGAWAEVPLGPVHLGAYGQLDHPLGSDSGVTYELAGASLRLGRDKPYWPHAHAGVGPMVSGGVIRASTDAASGSAWFVMAGLQLYGAD